MASTRKLTTKDGQIFYEIRVSRGRGKSYLTTRWYPSEGWSQKAIERALVKEAAEFERRCHDGEVITRAEQKESDLRQKREAAKIQTLQQYGETVFMPAKGVTMSENGRCAYQGNLNHWIYPALGDLKMPDITSANISALLLSSHAISTYVFTQPNSSEPMHPQSPARYMQKFSQRCGVPGLHPHKLRHTFASIAITNGADVASVSEKLGHSDKAVTLRMYTHADQESMKRASQIFREALKKTGQK